MIWTGLEDFLAMGGYGGYVWGSVVVTGAALALELVLLARRQRAALRTAGLPLRRGAA